MFRGGLGQNLIQGLFSHLKSWQAKRKGNSKMRGTTVLLPPGKIGPAFKFFTHFLCLSFKNLKLRLSLGGLSLGPNLARNIRIWNVSVLGHVDKNLGDLGQRNWKFGDRGHSRIQCKWFEHIQNSMFDFRFDAFEYFCDSGRIREKFGPWNLPSRFYRYSGIFFTHFVRARAELEQGSPSSVGPRAENSTRLRPPSVHQFGVFKLETKMSWFERNSHYNWKAQVKPLNFNIKIPLIFPHCGAISNPFQWFQLNFKRFISSKKLKVALQFPNL